MRTLTLIALLLLTACTGSNHLDYLRMRDIPPPTVESFTHCYNYGCATRVPVTLPEDTLLKIKKNFSPLSSSKKQERKRIIQSLQIFEKDIGNITGTKNDKFGTFRIYQDNAPSTQSFQQDCIDESTNTTIYLTLLNNMEFLKFYEPAFPVNRQPLLSNSLWWHQSAAIKDKKTGKRYAVDTWFEDNGKAGYIIPLNQWKDGWKPTKIETLN